MEANLKFKLPEEREEFDVACSGDKYIAVLTEFDNWLRSQLKQDNLPEGGHTTLTATRDRLYEICEQFNVNIW